MDSPTSDMEPILTDEHDGFEALFLTHQDAIFQFFKNRGFGEESHDLAQQTFLKAYRNLSQFRGDASPKTWLFCIARSTLLSSHREKSAKKNEAIVVPLDGSTPAVDPSRKTNPLNQLLDEEKSGRLTQAIGELPERMRHAVQLRVYQERDYKEIAILLKMDLNTVKSTLSHARKKLKEKLGSYFDDIDL